MELTEEEKERPIFRIAPYIIYTCGMYVVLYVATRKSTKKVYSPTAVVLFCHYFPLTKTSMQNKVWGCMEI